MPEDLRVAVRRGQGIDLGVRLRLIAERSGHDQADRRAVDQVRRRAYYLARRLRIDFDGMEIWNYGNQRRFDARDNKKLFERGLILNFTEILSGDRRLQQRHDTKSIHDRLQRPQRLHLGDPRL